METGIAGVCITGISCTGLFKYTRYVCCGPFESTPLTSPGWASNKPRLKHGECVLMVQLRSLPKRSSTRHVSLLPPPPCPIMLLLHLQFLNSFPSSCSMDKISASWYDTQGPPWRPLSRLFNLICPSPLYVLCSSLHIACQFPLHYAFPHPHIYFHVQIVLILSLGKPGASFCSQPASCLLSEAFPEPSRQKLALFPLLPSLHELTHHQSSYGTVLGLLFDML